MSVIHPRRTQIHKVYASKRDRTPIFSVYCEFRGRRGGGGILFRDISYVFNNSHCPKLGLRPNLILYMNQN